MAKLSEVSVIGDKEMFEKFKMISACIDTSEVEEAIYRVAKHVAGDARRLLDAQVRPKTGRLRKSIQAGKFRKRIKAYPGAWVMADRKIAPHAHLIEFGHVVRGHSPGLTKRGKKRKGKKFGLVAAFPFLRPALDRSGYSLRASVKNAVPKAIRRAIAKGARWA